MDKSERYLKEIAKNTDEIAKELKKMNRDKGTVNVSVKNDKDIELIRSAIIETDAVEKSLSF